MTSTATNFWSRRRAAVQAEEAALVESDKQRQALEIAQAQEEKTDAEILEEMGLKDPDLMEMGDDFSAFMQTAVPERLRRRALRRLWRSNPVLANLDGLVDHGEDYSDAATVLPDLKTTYQVGKGLLKHVMALAEQAEAQAAQAEALSKAPIIEPESLPLSEASSEILPVQSAQDFPPDTPTDAEAAPASRRHMRFTFEA